MRIIPHKGEPINEALKRLRKARANSGDLAAAKRRERCEKPSERRRREQKERRKTIRCAERDGAGRQS